MRFEEFSEFKARKNTEHDDLRKESDYLESTPLESIESVYSSLRTALISEVLDTMKSCSPAFFEKLVVDLLLRIGYGGSRAEAGRAFWNEMATLSAG